MIGNHCLVKGIVHISGLITRWQIGHALAQWNNPNVSFVVTGTISNLHTNISHLSEG